MACAGPGQTWSLSGLSTQGKLQHGEGRGPVSGNRSLPPARCRPGTCQCLWPSISCCPGLWLARNRSVTQRSEQPMSRCGQRGQEEEDGAGTQAGIVGRPQGGPGDLSVYRAPSQRLQGPITAQFTGPGAKYSVRGIMKIRMVCGTLGTPVVKSATNPLSFCPRIHALGCSLGKTDICSLSVCSDGQLFNQGCLKA